MVGIPSCLNVRFNWRTELLYGCGGHFKHSSVFLDLNFALTRESYVLLESTADLNGNIPQGLLPRLFLLFINNLAGLLTWNILLSADNLKIWRVVKLADYQIALQRDLDRGYDWSTQNMLEFNSAKCKIMSICHQNI